MNRANRPRLSRVSGSSYDSRVFSRAGDGSTLSLDFTTGMLDPRLTFTRSTNATFINSQGYVQYAFSNRIPNSASLSGFQADAVTATADPTEPGPVVAPSGTQATKITTNVGATSVGYSRNFGTGAGTATGMTYSIYIKPSRLNNGSGFRYAIRNETTGLNIYGVDVVWANSPVTVNEVIGASDGDYELISPDARGWYRLVLKVTNTSLIRPGDNMTVYAGYSGQGTGFFDTLGAYWAWGAQLEPGLTASPVYLTDSTSTGYFNTPRFDYDPITLTPRGLLIEATATNLLNWSESFASSLGTNNNWADTSIARTAGQADPANGTTAIRFTASAGNATVISSAAIGTSAQRTFSVWLRRVTGTGNIQFTTNNGATWSTQAITSSWVRYTFAATTEAQQVGIRIVTSADAIEIWGAQLEAGSGASSYIPTGASQGTRAADSCAIPLSAFGFSTTAGTLYADWYRKNSDSGSGAGGPWSTDYTTSRLFTVQNATASNSVYLASFGGQSFIPNGSTRNKAAATYGAWTGSVVPSTFCVNNSAVTSASRDFNPSTATYLTIGAASSSAGSSPAYGVATRDWLNNSIRSIKYWPLILPDATLQSLTT